MYCHLAEILWMTVTIWVILKPIWRRFPQQDNIAIQLGYVQLPDHEQNYTKGWH